MASKKKNKRRREPGPARKPAADSSPMPRPDAPSAQAGRHKLKWVIGFTGLLVVAAAALLWGRNWFGEQTSQNDVNQVSTEMTIPREAKSTWEQLDDPSQDGWQTEVVSDRATAQLKQLGKLLIQFSQSGDAESIKSKVGELIADSFQCGRLYPVELYSVYQDRWIEVQRKANISDSRFEQADGLVQALGQLAEPFRGAKDMRFKFKLFRVEPTESSMVTRQYFAVSGRTESGMLEQNATWVTSWATGASLEASQPPRLKSIEVEAFEQVRTQTNGQPLYVDCTQSALDQNESYRAQILRGYNHWLDRTESRPYWERLGTPGIAVGDANNDGLEDLYLCQERGIPNRLYVQNPDATLRDVSETAGVNWLEDSRSALFVDLDNDGDQDLVVGMAGGVVLAENDGDGHFEVRNVLTSSDDVKSIAAADYDLDGQLDVYVTVYYPDVFAGGEVQNTDVAAARLNQELYDTNQGGPNGLFRLEIRDGNWDFTDVTEQVGLNVNNARYSLAAAWEDFDNDGDADLYVANDYGRNNLYRNDDGKFTDIAAQAGVEDYNFAMSVTWGDYDRNGSMDVYIGNMFSAAGNRITTQAQFRPEASDAERDRFLHLARGNTLFQNLGDGTFADVSNDAGVTIGRWAWSSNFLDLNNDGWQDLLVANGMITTEDSGDC